MQACRIKIQGREVLIMRSVAMLPEPTMAAFDPKRAEV